MALQRARFDRAALRLERGRAGTWLRLLAAGVLLAIVPLLEFRRWRVGQQTGRVLLPRLLLVVNRQGDRKFLADRFDPVRLVMRLDELHGHLAQRSSSGWAKHADALRRISFLRFGSKFSRSAPLIPSH